MTIDKQYLDLLKKIISQGKTKTNRTGIDTKSITGHMLEYDMSNGFPLLTTKKMAWKTIRVELEGFIKGVTDKRWYKDRGCNIWNEWSNPRLVKYGHDDETKKMMSECNDLGPIYGYQWRSFNYPYIDGAPKTNVFTNIGYDQLVNAIYEVKNNPDSRRIIVSAWNPQQLNKMALVPCHYSFQLLCNNGTIDLLWNQRSVDVPLGLPFNIASYALLLELIAKECNLKPGKLIGFLADVHIYMNQMEGIREQLNREPFDAPTLELSDDYNNIFNWDWSKATLSNYKCHESIKMPVAV